MQTHVGYAGGGSPHPTYHNLERHAETISVAFDPTQISFEALLERFWASHDATYPKGSTQYRSILVCHDEAQFAQAMASAEAESVKRGARVQTDIVVDHPFHRAEAYHQKWVLRRKTSLWEELLENYGSEQAVIDSTVAARLNGYVSGHGSEDQIRRDLDRVGLSARGKETLAHFAKISLRAS